MNTRQFWVIQKRSLLDYSIFLMIFITLAWYNYTPLVIASQFLALGLSVITRSISLQRNQGYIVWWLLFCVFSGFSATYTPTTETIVSMMIAIIQVAAIGIVLVSYIVDYYNLEWVIKSICVSGVVLCLRLLIQVPRNAWGTERVGNFIGYGNDPAAIVLCFAALFLIVGFIKWSKKHYLLIAVLFCSVSIFTGSRKGILIVVVGLMVMIIFNKDSLSKRIYTLVLLIGCIVLGYYLIMEVPVLYNILGSRIEALIYTLTVGHRNVSYNNSSEERLLHMKTALGFFKSNPWFGLGLDGYRSVCPIRRTYSHCNFTELLADMGAIGFCLYYSYPFKILRLAVSSIRRNREFALVLGVVCAFIVCDIGMVTYMDETIHIYFATCAGLATILFNEENRDF